MSLTDDAKRVNARLAALPHELREHLRKALMISANEVAANVTALAPEDDGDLKASVAVTGPGETTPAYASDGGQRTAHDLEALVTVGNPQVRNGHLQEFGTAHHEAQPFMRPGWRIAKPRVERRLRRAIGAAIRKVIR